MAPATTPARQAASRENSRFSTGPVTDAGKHTVSHNALTHGLTSARVVLPNEDPAEYEAFARDIAARYNPVTPEEHTLTARIAAAEWRLARAWRAHDHFLASATASESDQFGCDLEPAAVLAAMLLTSADERRLRLILRYLRATERAHQSTIATLIRIQKARLAEPSAAPAANTASAQTSSHFPTAEEAAAIVAELDLRIAASESTTESAANVATDTEADTYPEAEAQTAINPAPTTTPALSRAERRARERAARKAARKAARLTTTN